MLNYSWAHSGVWNIVKRILPTSALGRIFFPSQKDIVHYFGEAALPQEYGGQLPCLARLSSLEEGTCLPPESPAEEITQETFMAELPAPSLPSWISPTSMLNPFFGYPATTSPSGRNVPALHHGRRRKRDLLRTLVFLWWNRWHSQIIFALCVSIAFLLVKSRRRLPVLRWFTWLRSSIHS